MKIKKFISLDGKRKEIVRSEEGELLGTIEPYYNAEDADIINAVQSTELGEALQELNSDKITDSRMSDIDLRSNLHPIECDSVLALDSLVALRFLPSSCLAFSRQKKRLVVSNHGRGRDDMVKVMMGKRDHDEAKAGVSVVDRVKGMFGGGQK